MFYIKLVFKIAIRKSAKTTYRDQGAKYNGLGYFLPPELAFIIVK
jgi:hypothetical protein